MNDKHVEKMILKIILTIYKIANKRRVYRRDVTRLLEKHGLPFSNLQIPKRYSYCECGKGILHSRNDHVALMEVE